MARSIYRNKQHADLIKRLTEKNPDTGVAVFSTIKALQCFAAVLGFDQKRRKPLDRSNVENIEWHTFSNDNLTHYIYLIALAETNDINVLKFDIEKADGQQQPTENMMEIFEEYANGGFEIIQGWLDKSPADPFGDKAVLVAMEKAGFLKKENNTFSDVEF
jgi:dnd system-associated protein 4